MYKLILMPIVITAYLTIKNLCGRGYYSFARKANSVVFFFFTMKWCRRVHHKRCSHNRERLQQGTLSWIHRWYLQHGDGPPTIPRLSRAHIEGRGGRHDWDPLQEYSQSKLFDASTRGLLQEGLWRCFIRRQDHWERQERWSRASWRKSHIQLEANECSRANRQRRWLSHVDLSFACVASQGH